MRTISLHTRFLKGFTANAGDGIPPNSKDAVVLSSKNGLGWTAKRINPPYGNSPQLITQPVITGEYKSGNAVETTNGLWSSESSVTYEYRWLRNGVEIPGEYGPKYDLYDVDVGFEVVSEVSAINAYGKSKSVSVSRGLVSASAPPYIPTGVLMDGFESSSSWSQGSALSASLDPSSAVQGVNSIKYSPNNAATTSPFVINKDFASFDMQTLGAYAFYVHLDEDLDWQDVNSVTMSVILNGGGTIYPGASKTVLANVQSGGMWISGNLSQFNEAVKAAGLGNHRFRISAQFANAVTGDASYDAFYRSIGTEVRPGIIITGDDAKIQQYTILYPLMKARGLLSGLELYPPTGYFRDVRGGNENFSYAEAKAMSDDGVSVQINGTSDDKVINLSPQRDTVEAWIADLNAQRDLIVSLGIPKPISFCYPFGFLRVPGTRVNRTGVSLTTGSNVLPMSSTTGIVTGMRAILPGVSRSCSVQSVQANTSVTLSENVQITATKAVSFVSVGSPFQGNAPQDAAIAAGYKWGRSTNGRNMFVGFGISRRQAMQYPSLAASGMTLSSFQTYVEELKASKSLGSIYVHDTTEWPEMIDCLDYLKSQKDAGLIDLVNTPFLEGKYGGVGVPTPD